MRRFAMAVAMGLLFCWLSSVTIFAQHTTGGGSSGGSSSGSSGGSHGGGGYSGGGGSSGGSSGHSSGGSVSHSSGSHGSSAGGSAAHSGAHSNARGSHSDAVRSVHEPGRGREPVTGTLKAQPERRSFFSFLRHPFRKPQPKPEPDLRRRICLNGRCTVCPSGGLSVGGKCVQTSVVPSCSGWEVWCNRTCTRQTSFVDNCAWLRMALAQQAKRLQAAELEQQNACSAGATQECLDLTGKAQSEASVYRDLQEQLRRCEAQSSTAYSTYSFASCRQGYFGFQ